MIASECSQHQGLHFHPWSSYIEFDPIGDTPDGPAYRLLITDLLNYGQPFIRYDTGDCVTLGSQQCACGRPFPLVSKILGRVCEGIVLPDGGIIPGITLGTQMAQMGHTFRSIAQVQFVQKCLDHIHLRYAVKGNETSKQSELSSICTAIDASDESTHELVARTSGRHPSRTIRKNSPLCFRASAAGILVCQFVIDAGTTDARPSRLIEPLPPLHERLTAATKIKAA